MASDHFHPWVPSQGQSAFVWSWMGALGATTKLRFGTGVTPPGYRYHPAIIAQAAATLEAMFPGRFYLGLGAGEALNEHIIGDYWPEAPVRLERLAESIEIIEQALHRQDRQAPRRSTSTSRAPSSTPCRARRRRSTSRPRDRSRPSAPARPRDGLITVGAADEKLKMLIDRFEEGAKEAGKDPATMPKIIQFKVSLADTEEAAIEQAVKEWPNGGMAFPKGDIRNPEDFEAMAKLVRPEHYKNRVLTVTEPRRARQADPALRRSRLQRGLRPQRRPRPGRVHRDLRQARHPEHQVPEIARRAGLRTRRAP